MSANKNKNVAKNVTDSGATFALVTPEGGDNHVKVWDTPVSHTVQCPNGHERKTYRSRQDAKDVRVACVACGARMKVVGTTFDSSLAVAA